MKDIKRCRVLVTPRSYGQHDPNLRTELEKQVGEVVYNTLGRPLTSEELRPLLTGIDGYIAGVDVIDRSALEGANKLKVIARYGVGCDKVDMEATREMGIVVTNTPGANSVSVAELTIGLMLSLARMIPYAVNATKSGMWPRISGLTLEGKVVGLVGFGSIGKQVARRLSGFNCSLLVYDPVPDIAFAEVHEVMILPQEEVVRKSDFLSFHLPLLPETRGMINAAFLKRMKPGSYLINTARGGLVDEEALLDALKSGRLRGAALDVFAQQPPGTDNPLLLHPHVIVTPHTGSHTDGATNAMGWAALKNCLAVLRREEPTFRVM